MVLVVAICMIRTGRVSALLVAVVVADSVPVVVATISTSVVVGELVEKTERI